MEDLSFRSRRRWLLAVLAAAVLGAVFFTCLFLFFRSHALPGSRVGDLNVGGLTQQQVVENLRRSAAAQSLVFQTPEGKELVAKPGETGVSVDVEETANRVFAANHSPAAVFRNLFLDQPVEAVVTVDRSQFATFAERLLPADETAPVDAAVHYDPDSGTYCAQESASGLALEQEVLLAKLEDSVASLQEVAIAVPVALSEAAVGTDSAVAAAALANSFLDTSLQVSDANWNVWSPDRETRVSWLNFAEREGGLVPSLDGAAVDVWLQEAAAPTTDEPVTGLRNVSADGKQLAISVPGADGYGVTNRHEVAAAFADALDEERSAEVTFTYGDLPAPWEDRPAAVGTENLPYQPAEEEKWLDLNLTTNTVTAYEGAEIVGGPWYIVPGEPRTPTVTGEYNVYLKYELQDMRGLNVDGSRYLTRDVPWVTYFYGGYAFHGAPWRSSFGWSGPGGSHGCVNMEPVDAKFIYDWADYGTKVVSRY